MARLLQIVIDSQHPARLAQFWSAALDGFSIRPYDREEIERLAALGFTPDTDPTVLVDGPHLELCFQHVETAGYHDTKSPLHFDLDADDLDTEVERLEALGAAVIQRFGRHVWMRDPEAHDFCVVHRPKR